MDVAVPIRSVIPSLDADVYRVLAGTTEPLSARRIHAASEAGSRAGVQKVLRRMLANGLVVAVDAPPAVLYSANRDHLAWGAIEQLVRLRSALIERLTEAISVWQLRPNLAAMYSSAARSDGDSSSDIDLFFIVDTEHRDDLDDELDRLMLDVQHWTGNSVQPTVFSPDDVAHLEAVDDATYRNIRRDAVVLFGSWRQP